MEKYLNVIFFLSALIVTGNRANLETRWNILVAAVGALVDGGGMGTNVLPLCMIFPVQLLKLGIGKSCYAHVNNVYCWWGGTLNGRDLTL